MSRRFQFSLVAILTCLVGCSAKSPQAKPSDKTETKATVYVFRLDGQYYNKLAETSDGPFEPPENNLRKWPILEKKLINDPTLADDLNGAVCAPANFGGSGSDCFWPGMAITVGEGDERIDAIICLECDWLYLYAPDGSAEKKALSERGHQEFSNLFAKAFPEQAKH